jgi:predicted alpha/beta superfamily hydrolase
MMSFRLAFSFAGLLVLTPTSPLLAAERAHTAQPNVHVLAPLHMPGLGRERIVRVYLPPSYESSTQRYPVLYMHDGQNLFDDATSFIGEWGVDEMMNELARTKQLEAIVVGIDHGDEKRTTELNPWDNEKFGKGEGRDYLRFVVGVVKPYVDVHFRTLPDRAHTAMMGSSLGGLISHFAMYEYGDVFSRIGIFSPAYWIAPDVREFTHMHVLAPHTHVWFYAGSMEDSEMVANMDAIVAIVREQRDSAPALRVEVTPGAVHNEQAWRVEFPRAVEWLFEDAH